MAIKSPTKRGTTHSVHPETKQPRPAVGVPGSESSKSKHQAPDQRNADDKDGNEQQVRRTTSKP